MLKAEKTRVRVDARLLGFGLVGAAFALGAGSAYAEEGDKTRAPAPITYAGSTSAPSSVFTNSASNLSVAAVRSADLAAPSKLTFDQFQGRTPNSAPALASGALDLRAGAVQPTIQKVTYGPSAPALSRPETLNGSYSIPQTLPPAALAPSEMAEPYAGPPYQVEGKWYVPTHEPTYNETGVASWYGPGFHKKSSASGETYDQTALTAAHPTLPIPSIVRVTNLENGKTVLVRLNDRGPFVDDRIIDLSRRAAETLDMTRKGTAKVRVEYVGPAPKAANTLPADPEFANINLPQQPVAQPAQPRLVSIQAPVQLAGPAAPIAAAPLTETRGFFVQAGSFADLANASAARNKLAGLGPVTLTTAQVNGTEFYRVMLGPWSSRAEAERMQGRVIENGGKAFVVAKLGE